MKFWYHVKVLLTPLCWIRNSKIDKEWDSTFRKMLEDGKIEFQTYYEAYIGGYVVWIGNYPYASGCTSVKEYSGRITELACSRATALFLGDELKKALIIQKLKGPYDRAEVLEKTWFYI